MITTVPPDDILLPALSTGATELLKGAAVFKKISLLLGNQYSSANEKGIINFGVAENSLMYTELKEFLRSKFELINLDFTYGDHFLGSTRLFGALANLFNTRFNPLLPVKPEHLVTANGASSIVDQAAAQLCNPGDAVLIARPYYNGFNTDLMTRAKARPVGIDVGSDPSSPAALDAFERTIQQLKADGVTTRAVILCNPQNPLGFNYPRDTLLAYCRFCERHNLHLLSDEIYALSQFANPAAPGAREFTSILNVDVLKEAGCNPARVHVIYGMSKDFCANGLRIGVLVTQHNPELRESFMGFALFSKVSSAADTLWSALLNDAEMLDRFITGNQRRLAETFAHCAAFMRKHSIPFVEPTAAHFIWLDLRKLLRDANDDGKVLNPQEKDEDLWLDFLNEGLFVGAGFSYNHTEPGWFRFTFCVDRAMLDVGLARFTRVVERRTAEHYDVV